MDVEALLTPQINGECSLAGVSASCCGAYIRSNCFWSGRGTTFSPVGNTALAPSQIILIPSPCSLCCSTKDSRESSDLGNLTIFIKFLLLHTVTLLVFVLVQNTCSEITQQIVQEDCFNLVPTRAGCDHLGGCLMDTDSVQWWNARTCIIQLLFLESSTFKIGYKNCTWI